jgi:HAD superfamily hydrolase (TIGR01662 family)
MEQVDAVNEQVERRLGPIDTWQVCPHQPADDCDCRKPRPGLVVRAAAELGLSPREVIVVGDIGADLAAAASAGSRAILVPTRATLAEETAAADAVAPTLSQAVDMVLDRQE